VEISLLSAPQQEGAPKDQMFCSCHVTDQCCVQALTKFLKCVEWTKPDWTNDEALQLMRQWDPIDLEDSLELLSFRFRQVPEIRSYAVERLKAANDEVCTTIS
jgi:hypothetical protein